MRINNNGIRGKRRVVVGAIPIAIRLRRKHYNFNSPLTPLLKKRGTNFVQTRKFPSGTPKFWNLTPPFPSKGLGIAFA